MRRYLLERLLNLNVLVLIRGVLMHLAVSLKFRLSRRLLALTSLVISLEARDVLLARSLTIVSLKLLGLSLA
jgi:hypothetical protein